MVNLEWLLKCTKMSDSVRDHSLSESKVLGLGSSQEQNFSARKLALPIIFFDEY